MSASARWAGGSLVWCWLFRMLLISARVSSRYAFRARVSIARISVQRKAVERHSSTNCARLALLLPLHAMSQVLQATQFFKKLFYTQMDILLAHVVMQMYIARIQDRECHSYCKYVEHCVLFFHASLLGIRNVYYFSPSNRPLIE